MATTRVPRASIAVATTVLFLSACQHHSVQLRPARPRVQHNPLSLGAPWGVVTSALGAPAGPPVWTATDVMGTFGQCASGATAYAVRALASHAGQAVNDMPVVEIDATTCAGRPTLEEARLQAKAFFPDLSGVVERRSEAALYSSQPLIRLVPPAAFFVCQALASSAARLGRFSLRVEATGWKLAVGDCMSDAAPGSPVATP